MKTLVVVAHSDLKNRSIANNIIVSRLEKTNDVEIRDLYALYPDYKIDVDAEQNALLNADMVIFQYPIHWYSIPGLLKEWMDRVFLRGFAYGADSKLNNKGFLVSTTVGGPKESYREGGHNNFPVKDFLKPLQQSASFTGMKFHEPIVSYDMVYIPDGDRKAEEIEARAAMHADKIVSFLGACRATCLSPGH